MLTRSAGVSLSFAVASGVIALGCGAPPNVATAAAAETSDAADHAIVEVPWEPGPLPEVPGPRAAGAAIRRAGLRPALEFVPATADFAAPTTGTVIDGGKLGHDPQIAASDRFLFVYNSHRYRLFDKATARPLAATPGSTIAPAGDFGTLFSPLWAPRDRNGNPNAANVNLLLHFAADDPLACDAESPLDSRACVQEFYDSRIQWDPWRKRFWIESAARNHLWFCRKEPCTDEKWTRTQARRFIAVAVSRTEDPRDGFHRYILVDQYTDWPKIAVSERHLILGHRASPTIFVFDADKLAAGNPDKGPVRIAKLEKGSFPGATFLAPVTQHGTTGGVTFLLGTDEDDHVTPFALVGAGRGLTVVPGPTLAIGQKLRTFENNPIYRDGKLYFTWDECADGANPCTNQVRVARLPARLAGGKIASSLDASAGYLNVIIGKREPDDAEGDLVRYQKPAIDVNGRGDVVVVYARRAYKTRADLFPEVRYSILYAGETRPRAGVLLKRGTTGDVPDINQNEKAGIDLAFAQVDPTDDHTVWVTHAYGDAEARWFKQIVAAVKP